MRWLRDNWIDALIFTVFAITVVGIVLFLTGVNPFKPRGPVVSPTATPTTGVVERPAANEKPAGEPSGESTGEAQTPPVTVVPLLPGAGEDSGAKAEPQPSAAGAGGARSAVSTAPAENASPTTGGQQQTEVKLPGGPEEGVFRVSVGAYARPENALALAEKLEKQGYPVRLEPVGRVTRVVVGPYPTRTQAAQAARKLAGYEPQVYRGDTPEPQGIYLQVGAYKKFASAAGLVEKLGAAGIGPVVFYYQEPWLKVWVGPVAPNEVDALKKRLQDLGLQVVEVR